MDNQEGQKKKFYKQWWFWVIAVIAALVIAGSMEDSSTNSPVAQTPQEVASVHVFDIPALLGKDIGALEKTLGTPSNDTEPTATQLELGTDTWEKSWTKGEYSVMATYDVKTKKVIDLFLGADSDAAFKRFEDTNNILAAANLSRSDSRYSVEFVKARNGPGYTGVIVKAK